MKKDRTGLLGNISKSGFVRSVITRVLVIFITVSIVITAVSFFSFTSEIRKSILKDRQNQLSAVEKSISGRMDEIASIAYNIGSDSVFYLEPISDNPNSGREMSAMLKRYLVGNSFIEYIAYCRTAEPDVIYTAKGERLLSEFLQTSLGVSKNESDNIIRSIHSDSETKIAVIGSGENAYFTYGYPLPQLATEPKAHVLMMIPVKKVKPLLETLLYNSNGEAAVFDTAGNKIYSIGNIGEELALEEFVKNGAAEENYKSPAGHKYVLQKIVSESNRWTYVSVTNQSDTLTGLANKQLAFIAFVLLLLMASVIFMIAIIITQYKPISKLAAQVADDKMSGEGRNIVDEVALLSDTFATLKDDSEQKQKYETAYYEAESASRAKSAFLSSMSHDIRTPMNAIIGMTAIARKHIDDREYVDDCLKKVQVSSDYLLNIINNVLDMSRIESGRIPIAKEPVLLPALIDSAVSLITSGAEAKSQTIEVGFDGIIHPAVLGDSIHIVQVFVNILSNAVKFTPECGKLSVRASEQESDDPEFGDYTFIFADTGIGMPPEFVNHVFDTFSRADDSTTSKTEGTGLGMAIAKKLVGMMDGTISCESEPGHGTVFTVCMHMKYTDTSSASVSVSGSHLHADSKLTVPSLSGKRILLVEDNAMNREIACKIICETGAEIAEANNGKEAADAFSASTEGYFDLILMDIQMPLMNGYDATLLIRSMDRADAASVPIYAMTANTFDEDIRRVRDAGMSGHIGKPYIPSTLYNVLSRTLGEQSRS